MKGHSPVPAFQKLLISLGTDTKLRIQNGIRRNVLRVTEVINMQNTEREGWFASMALRQVFMEEEKAC